MQVWALQLILVLGPLPISSYRVADLSDFKSDHQSIQHLDSEIGPKTRDESGSKYKCHKGSACKSWDRAKRCVDKYSGKCSNEYFPGANAAGECDVFKTTSHIQLIHPCMKKADQVEDEVVEAHSYQRMCVGSRCNLYRCNSVLPLAQDGAFSTWKSYCEAATTPLAKSAGGVQATKAICVAAWNKVLARNCRRACEEHSNLEVLYTGDNEEYQRVQTQCGSLQSRATIREVQMSNDKDWAVVKELEALKAPAKLKYTEQDCLDTCAAFTQGAATYVDLTPAVSKHKGLTCKANRMMWMVPDTPDMIFYIPSGEMCSFPERPFGWEEGDEDEEQEVDMSFKQQFIQEPQKGDGDEEQEVDMSFKRQFIQETQ